MQDVNFDNRFVRFRENIARSLKGQIRLKVLQHHINAVSGLEDLAGWKVLDAGGGLGDMSLFLAERGADVEYTDISARMTEHFSSLLSDRPSGAERIQCIHGAFQDRITSGGRYDLIHCQAVLEWLADPDEGLRHMIEGLHPGGYLVVTLFNEESIRFKNLIKGNIRRAFSDHIPGDENSLTPLHPLSVNWIFDRLGDEFEVLDWFGLRAFSDYLFPHVDRKSEVMQAAITEAELELSSRSPYRELARYIGVIARKKGPTTPSV